MLPLTNSYDKDAHIFFQALNHLNDPKIALNQPPTPTNFLCTESQLYGFNCISLFLTFFTCKLSKPNMHSYKDKNHINNVYNNNNYNNKPISIKLGSDLIVINLVLCSSYSDDQLKFSSRKGNHITSTI